MSPTTKIPNAGTGSNTEPGQTRTEPPQTGEAAARAHGLRSSEYRLILAHLGREPNAAELGVYSAMWSEHCAYKHSRAVLRRLPTEGERVVAGPGGNAGAVDIGGGLCAVFKMESHNHPSAIEPYQGAATGVGGILRDVFAMGARPIALLDNLRFGKCDSARMQRLVRGVVSGIADYGNCVGVPTVAGDVVFDAAFERNILVNVMCVGIAPSDRLAHAMATGEGNVLLYFGSPTGRDGMHGASFASEALGEEAAERRGAVQVGDPFMGKKILEATLELIELGLVTGMQDMGAGGLACAASEMAAAGAVGIELDLDLIPARADAMNACELLLSESQERMLAVVEPGKLAAALEVCARFECDGHAIGRVTNTGRMIARHGGELAVDLNVAHLVLEAPVYRTESPRHEAEESAADSATNESSTETTETNRDSSADTESTSARQIRRRLTTRLASPNLASKRWIYRQFDHTVQGNTVVRPGDADAAVLRVMDTEGDGFTLLAVASGGSASGAGRGSHASCDPPTPHAPYRLGFGAVCEVARRLVCTGAEPLGLTNCLNFGSPEKSGVFADFERCVEGMAAASRALGIPVTGGNVSFYNETDGIAIPPTPIVGMVGRIEQPSHITRVGFAGEGDLVWVLGCAVPNAADSAESVETHSPLADSISIDPAPIVELHRVLARAIRSGLIASAHDAGRGGLAVALARCCTASRRGLGFIAVDDPGLWAGASARLFAVDSAQVIISCDPAHKIALTEWVAKSSAGSSAGSGLEFAPIGTVGGDELRLAQGCAIPLDELHRLASRHPLQ